MSLYRFAIAIAALTFVLLLLGGLVHNTGSSLACPDWPLCFGSAFPKMEGGVRVEHTHRLVASSVGLLTTVLAVLMARRAARTGERGLLGLGATAFVCVVAQGVLGGITVLYRLPTLVSTGHLALSMLFLCLLIYIAFRLRPVALAPPPALTLRTRRLIMLAAGAAYTQIVLGALMRHLGAGLACVDLPLCHGRLWPAGEHPSVLLHAGHRLLALAVLVLVAATAVSTVSEARGRRSIKALAALAPLLVLGQIVLGVMSIRSFLGLLPVTAHLGGAALLLADLLMLHLLGRSQKSAAAVAIDPSHAGAAA